MKKNLTTAYIKILGHLKRSLRIFRVFLKKRQTAIKYTFLATVSLASLAAIIILLAGGNLGLDILLNINTQPTPSQASSPTPIPTETPTRHIYGESPLVILDCSEFNDDGFIAQMASEFSQLNELDGQYYKVSPNEFIDTYNQMKEAGNTPNVVIAPTNLLQEIGELEDVSRVNAEVLFNNAAKGAVASDKIPIALEMYAYFFRADLLFAMSHEIPRSYNEFVSLGERLRSDYAYDYLRYTEENEQLKDRKDEFLTSRYGFGVAGDDVGGQLFIEQSIQTPFEDGTSILHHIQLMWEELYLPPDLSYATDSTIARAYLNDALVSVFTSGILYENLYLNGDLFYSTQVKPYLGHEQVYTVNVIYCAIPQGTDSEVASNFLSMLYDGGDLDKIIAKNHVAYFPVSNFVNQQSPWKDAINEGAQIIYYQNDYYAQVVKRIIMAGEDVQTALERAKTQTLR